MSKLNTIVDWCVNSLETEPEAWSPYFIGNKVYHVTHRNGVQIWLANSHYGLDVNYRGHKIGGVTVGSSFFGAFIPWRRRIRRAALNAINYEPRPELTSADHIIEAIGA